jgi:hypothetical protein
MSGGVSSDIWRVDGPSGTFCVKRALARLKVAADWRAPVGRNRNEVAWFRTAGAIVPEAVPAILGDDPAGGSFAMRLPRPDRHPVWKALLRDGTVDPATSRAVGDVLAGSMRRPRTGPTSRRRSRPMPCFHAIRLEPYLEATGRAHPDLAGRSPRWSRRPRRPGASSSTATSAPRTCWSGRRARWSSTPSARGSAIRRSTSRSC